jgi:hypothetical protein
VTCTFVPRDRRADRDGLAPGDAEAQVRVGCAFGTQTSSGPPGGILNSLILNFEFWMNCAGDVIQNLKFNIQNCSTQRTDRMRKILGVFARDRSFVFGVTGME